VSDNVFPFQSYLTSLLKRRTTFIKEAYAEKNASARKRLKCNKDSYLAYRKSFGRSSESDVSSFLQLVPRVCGIAAHSTSPRANKSQTKSTQIIADSGNGLCCYPRTPCTSADVHIHSLGFLFGHTATLKLEPWLSSARCLECSILASTSPNFSSVRTRRFGSVICSQ
jgi:hypothetical protein